MKNLLCLLTLCAGPALAGGSNYGIVPGALPEVAGKVTEWAVPTPKFARDPAPGPDGNIYIAVMTGNRIARFDVKSKSFNEWGLPHGAKPHGLLVDAKGIVWYTGNGKLAKVDPQARRIVNEYALPAGRGGGPYAVTVDAAGRVWANEIATDTVALLDPQTEAFRVIKLPSRNIGIRKAIIDAQGRYWYMGSHNGKLGVIE